MKLLISLSFCLLISPLFAQNTAEESAIMKPVKELFEGMKLGDSSIVRSAFAKDATLASISRDKEGTVVVKRESSVDSFIKAVGTPHKDTWNEPIWDIRIEHEGDLSQVWARYAFFLGKNFNHCGIDAFQLAKINGEWKIIHLSDTREKIRCEIPKEITNAFK
jgi:hypothetical protein